MQYSEPPPWTQVLKYDVPATQDTGSFGGIDFTLDGNSGTSGTFTLSWFADPDNLLPAFMDMVFVLKAGNAFAGYLFEDEKIDNQGGGSGSSDGTWDITFTNNGGNIPNLSHLSLYMRTGDEPDTPNETVPVPGTLLLLGLGLIGLRFRSKA